METIIFSFYDEEKYWDKFILIIMQNLKHRQLPNQQPFIEKANEFLYGFVYKKQWFEDMFKQYTSVFQIIMKNPYIKSIYKTDDITVFFRSDLFSKFFAVYVGCMHFPASLCVLLVKYCFKDREKIAYYNASSIADQKGMIFFFFIVNNI
jgi:hypothetical protein